MPTHTWTIIDDGPALVADDCLPSTRARSALNDVVQYVGDQFRYSILRDDRLPPGEVFVAEVEYPNTLCAEIGKRMAKRLGKLGLRFAQPGEYIPGVS